MTVVGVRRVSGALYLTSSIASKAESEPQKTLTNIQRNLRKSRKIDENTRKESRICTPPAMGDDPGTLPTTPVPSAKEKEAALPTTQTPIVSSPATPVNGRRRSSTENRDYRNLYNDLKIKTNVYTKNTEEQLAAHKEEINGLKENLKSLSAQQRFVRSHGDEQFLTKGKKKKCEFPSCSNDTEDALIKCNVCGTWVCESCNDFPISKVKPIMSKCPGIFIACISCRESPISTSLDSSEKSGALERELSLKINELNKKIEEANKDNAELRDQLQDALTDAKLYNLKIKSLEEEAERSETSIRELREQLSEKAPQIDALNAQNESCTATIARLNAEMKTQREAFDQAGNPDFDNLVKLEKYMKKEITDLGKSIKESLVKEIQENNKLIEEKLSIKQAPVAGRPWHLQSDDVSSEQEAASFTQTPATIDFRSIIQEQQKQQIDEVNDQRSRARNVIIHGVTEANDAQRTEAKKLDEDFAKGLLRSLDIDELKFKSVNRIGMKSPEKKRPLLLIMNSEGEKDKLLQSLTKLKDKADYKGISVTDDYTIAERKLITEWRDKAKAKNTEEGEASKYIWRVRGTPKNGLSLKRFMKQRPSSSQGI